MKKAKLFLITILILIGTYSCKKDYPKDIPNWLKSKIKELDKESKGKGCIYDVCMDIEEYKYEANILYLFQPGSTPIGYIVYDYNGTELCHFETIQPDTCGCVSNFKNYQFNRLIWKEK